MRSLEEMAEGGGGFSNIFNPNKINFLNYLRSVKSERGTLEWWISGLMHNLLFFANLETNISSRLDI